MKTLFSLILSLLLIIQAQAQNNLYGTITEENTDDPLPGATIFIPQLNKGVTTDKNGNFEFKNLPTGSFKVETRFVGYSSKVETISIEGNTRFNLELSPSATEIGEVIVTGTAAATERTINPIPTLSVGNLTTGITPSTNLIDAIAKQPGVSQITTGPAISKPIIRGLGSNRVVVLHDGLRQEGQQWGDEHGVEIDQYAIDRAEIIKGPGSLMYGSDAMAGVINFLPPKPVETGKIIGNIEANYQSNNNLQAYSAMNAGNVNGIDWLARITSKKAGDYQNAYDGKVFNSGFEELDANASLGITRKWGYSRLSVSNWNNTIGIVEGERDENGNFIRGILNEEGEVEEVSVTANDLNGYGIGLPRQTINHFRVASNNKFFLGESALNVNLGFQQNNRREFEEIEDSDTPGLDLLLSTFNYDVKYLLSEINGWESTLGINGMIQNSRNRGFEFLIPDFDLTDGGIFALTQRDFGKWFISGGLRFDMRNINSHALYLHEEDEHEDPDDHDDHEEEIEETRFTAFDTFFANYSASLGASYRITDRFIAKLNLAKGFRSPNISELGSNGVHHGTLRYEIGNPDLKPENSYQVDFGIVLNTDHVSLEATVFNNYITNFIYLEKDENFEIPDDGDDHGHGHEEEGHIEAFRYVQNNANLYGGELMIDLHPHPLDWLHFQNTFSYVRGIQIGRPEGEKNVPFIPAPNLLTELKAQFNQAGRRLRNLSFSFGVNYFFPQNHAFTAFDT
ncbi:TonB-dependent receptor, partial [Xanthovirga aplysinae]|uniref:TonB-dependent receptor n=1 Tax=Xanthovirga aplysinae TaxID=2529853 RepID=UPI0012BB524F